MKKSFLLIILSLSFVTSSFAQNYWRTSEIVKDYERTKTCVNEVEAFYKFWQKREEVIAQCARDSESVYIFKKMEKCIERRNAVTKLLESESTTYQECAKRI
ncbi:Uncharacterised protein [Phocoenobacter uteri]|uniref:Uncharacterized protein n=1 Tax=Phocoenobacter uteri TaxID=146806 RepID=A0A379CBN2_9PAST|nr:hypothetical protein [Phocoenobacter uteri]MDG6881113.1 hypothetical protein [Phocoenobacter uteri]SUB59135.1 Uncharacterised protein [Phocoenobacter uteri]